jgi:hypothetical protein
MGPTSVTWQGLTLATGKAAPYKILSLEGWEERPAARFDKVNRTNGHGSHPSAIWSDERTVTVEGFCFDPEQRDAMLAGIQDVAAFDDGCDPITVTAAGRTLTANAQLVDARPVLERGKWGIGWFGWLLQWRCPDPLRYGPTQSASTGLPTASGGLTYPLTYPLSYGTVGATGQITMTNPGTADAPVRFTVTGTLAAGFEISAGTRRITYPDPVPAGQTIVIDTGAGSVLVEGTTSRRGRLTSADWLQVSRKGTLTVQFTSLSGLYTADASLTAAWAETRW